MSKRRSSGPGKPVSPARVVAFEVLKAVEEGGYASDVLRERSQDLDSRDAGLAAQIVFGTLRWQAQLDYLIFLYSGRRPRELDGAVVIVLRSAIYQLRYLERIPAHAAVDEAVELVKKHKRAAAGLINAVLRKVNRQPVTWPDGATELSLPDWLLARWDAHFGRGAAEGVARAALEEPEAYIRVPEGGMGPEGIQLEETMVAGAFRVVGQDGAAYKAGLRLHDIGSQAMMPLLDLAAGQSYLDLCAAPGNKTVQALETRLGLAVACDISWKRLREVRTECPRVVLDATRELPFMRQFDRVFIDAPCSGTGTIGRNPEIKWRVQERDFTRFGEMQRRILGSGLGRLAPGGKLLYATCSLEREENEDVVREVVKGRDGVRIEKEIWRLPGREPGDGFYGAVLVRT